VIAADRPQRRGYLGVDMGGSTTRAHLSAGPETREWTAPGGNLTIDRHAARDILISLIAEANPLAACLGLAGARTAPDAVAWLTGELAALDRPITMVTDADLALAAALGPDDDGIVVCAGTGSVAIVRSQGVIHLVGGHGYLLGDAGSAYDIGRRTLAAALRERDDGGHDLVDEVEAAMDGPLDVVVGRVYASTGERAHLALLAEQVSAMHSPAARTVIAEAADALVALVTSARRRFGDLPVRTMGGVFRDPVIAGALREAFHAVPAAQRPEVAAAQLAERSAS